ncbi:hypothetical protein GCM10023085_65490 [Actinomadura viridis]|uniref:NlpC/P60 domain-containing protein n=1 Tax=Actinomadura viridis TaxID=58110 RepID=A0A931GNJ6_9ACTN|nr:NlpC/P60 family protein [Actinomadura viridis]MBG6093035.1 hypothetical protein [Actinomadura viridis]
MDEVDRSPRRPSDSTADQAPAADPTLDLPEVVPGAEVDPRALAAAQAPQNAADIVAEHTSGGTYQGSPGEQETRYGAGSLPGYVRPSGAANPITGQRALDAATGAGGEPETETTEEGVAAKPANARKRPLGGLTERAERAGVNSALSSAAGHLADEGMRRGGQAADQVVRLAANRYAPGVYDAVKNSRLGRRGLDWAEGSRLGGKLPKSFWNGFRGDGKKGKGGKQKAKGSGSGEGSSRGKYKVTMAVAVKVLVPFVCVLLFFAMIMGFEATDGDTQVQPEDASDAEVAKYFPEGWQRILQQASDKAAASGAEDFATVPWTVLAGIAATQTDFARYSPYDNIDRDPGRTATAVPRGGGTGGEGGDVEDVANTGGAGPGPISGVSGAGSTATVGSGHPGPPSGDLSHQMGWFLYALRMHESGGNYTSGKGKGGACGAYQYMNGTWNNYGGRRTACDAPPSMQDRRAREDVIDRWQRYKKWQQVAVAHFYPKWANSPENWDRCPAACHVNPTVWEYVDDVMDRMQKISQRYPATAAATPTTEPASFRWGSPGREESDDQGAEVQGSEVQGWVARGANGRGRGVSAGSFAGGCAVADPDPDIGGKDGQGSGPFLLSPAAAGQMRLIGLDPQNPCDSAEFTARQLATAAKRVHADPDAPEWKANGKAADQENARKYWGKVIEASGIFVDRSADPDAPCAVPPPDDPEKPWSVSFKIISIWRCETTRMPELYLVTGGEYQGDEFKYTVETDRTAATRTLVNEAMSVSYGASRWKTDKCDDGADGRQGVFPMTKEEARAAGVDDRCDVDANIAGAAELVLSVERVPPKERPSDLGVFQPMVGGWQKLGIAMGTDLELFSLVGPGQGFSASDACTQVMTRFLTAIAPHAKEFAKLKEPPGTDAVYGEWLPKLTALEEAHGLTDPGDDPACRIGSWSPGYNAALAQIATGLADGGANTANLNGLGEYYQGREDANRETEPVLGEDTLVVPRLALRPLKPIGAPVAPDATEAWSRLGSSAGVPLPLSQVAVEYAWFFGGVIAPFDSAGKLIGSLAEGQGTTADSGATQVTIGPDGCPENARGNTLRHGSAAIGIHKLCVDSVAQARTPEAAKAIKWALANLNLPYCMCVPERNQDNFADCSSFVSKAYRNSGAIPNLYQGNAPTTDTLRNVRWTHQIPLSQAKPGDLVEPHPGHVAMQLTHGYMVHTNTRKDVSRVERAYSSAYWVGWVDATKV